MTVGEAEGALASAAEQAPVAALTTALSQLESAIAKLHDRVARLEDAAKSRTAPPDQIGGTGPGSTAARRAGPGSVSTTTAAPPLASDLELAPMAEAHELLCEVFQLVLEDVPADPDEADAQFDRFKALSHSNRRGSPLLDQSLRAYTWAQLRRNVRSYLTDPNDVGTYQVSRTQPEKPIKGEERMKVFLHAPRRMPAPITLRRDGEAGGRWRVEVSSL